MTRIAAVIFDWAGTIVDFGSRAPMSAFVQAFREFNVDISVDEARGPMGLPKLDHIRALGRIERVAAAWEAAQGSPFDEASAHRVYDVFVPLNTEVVAHYGALVPGALETVAALRARGIKIGSTTGYTRNIMARLMPVAAEAGYIPDNVVCADDLPAGRPTPLMMYKCFVDLAVWPAAACIKVDDTEPGIAEGVAAGAWTVGVSLSGNAVGLSTDELAGAPEAEVKRLKAAAEQKLQAAGAHFVIDTVANLMPVVEDVEARLSRGETPS